MLHIAGRLVKFAKGRGKTQTVNICTEEGRAGAYDWVLVVSPPRIEDGSELREFEGDSIEDFVAWVQRTFGASIRQHPVRASSASSPSDSVGLFDQVDRVVAQWLDTVDGGGFGLDTVSLARRLSGRPMLGVEALVCDAYRALEQVCDGSTRQPSAPNWRFEKMLDLAERNRSDEKILEKHIARFAGPAWANQMPVASGLVSSGDRHRNVDLVHDRGDGTWEFVELKVASNNPVFAAIEILKFGLVFVYSRRHRDRLGFRRSANPALWADAVDLVVLAPRGFYADLDFRDLAASIDGALGVLLDPFTDGPLRMRFRFEAFPDDVRSPYGPDAARRVIADREPVWPSG